MTDLQQEELEKQMVTEPPKEKEAQDGLLKHNKESELSPAALDEAIARLKQEGILTG